MKATIFRIRLGYFSGFSMLVLQPLKSTSPLISLKDKKRNICLRSKKLIERLVVFFSSSLEIFFVISFLMNEVHPLLVSQY
jgi:hypothetical protein